MGTLTRSLANNITTGGVIAPAGITNATVADITSFPNASGGTLVLLSTQTASASATISFTTGLDSTYDEYIFKFINIHPSASDEKLGFNLSTDGGSNYNVAKTTTYFLSYHNEADTQAALSYDPYGIDLAQGTGNNFFCVGIGNENDECLSGSMTLFNPSSTTYVKHFIGRANNYYQADYSMDNYFAGYGNTTSAVNAIRFQMSSGNIDDGIIKLYGVKKS
jgi:hypothetical protein